MARDYFINGESLVQCKGNVASAIPVLTPLGLSDGPISWRPVFRHKDIQVDAYGGDVGSPEIQFQMAEISVRMTLIHFDRTVLDTVITESMAGAPAIGQLPHTGARMGNGVARFAAGNHFMGLNITSPVGNKPLRFFYSFLAEEPMEFPLGTEKSAVVLNWRCVSYPPTGDPWNGGQGSQGGLLFDYNQDT